MKSFKYACEVANRVDSSPHGIYVDLLPGESSEERDLLVKDCAGKVALLRGTRLAVGPNTTGASRELHSADNSARLFKTSAT